MAVDRDARRERRGCGPRRTLRGLTRALVRHRGGWRLGAGGWGLGPGPGNGTPAIGGPGGRSGRQPRPALHPPTHTNTDYRQRGVIRASRSHYDALDSNLFLSILTFMNIWFKVYYQTLI